MATDSAMPQYQRVVRATESFECLVVFAAVSWLYYFSESLQTLTSVTFFFTKGTNLSVAHPNKR